jgi:hypothetical protein
MKFSHNAQIIYQSIISVLQEFNLKRDLENKDWIDPESRMQHDTTFEAATSVIETQESRTNIPDISLEDDSDYPNDIQDNDLWYICTMTSRSLIFLIISIFLSIFKYFNYFLNLLF